MGYFYILLMNNKKYYVWSTRDINLRIEFHKLWLTKTTKDKEPEIVFNKQFDTYDEAYYWERYIKKMKSKKIIEKIISWNWERTKC